MSSCSGLTALLSVFVLFLGTICAGERYQYVYRNNGIVTFILEGKISLVVTYPTVAGPKKTQKMDVPPPSDVVMEQTTVVNVRGEVDGLVTNISWSEHNFTLQMTNRANDEKGEWWVTGLLFAYNSTPPIVDSTPRTGVVSQTFSLYHTNLDQPYQCGSASFVLYGSEWSNATVTLEKFKLQAFQFANGTFGDKPQECVSPLADASSIVLPVVIGAVLLFLAVLSISAYALGCWCSRRKRKPAAYRPVL